MRAYISPAFSAILAQIVPPDLLVKAASYYSMSWLMAAVAGPLIAGILVGILDVSFSFLIVASVMLLTICIFSMVSEKTIGYNRSKIRTWESVREGVDFVWGQRHCWALWVWIC
ncbi:MAG: MFS transporter [Saprospiraceae bacterium]|nr:MFS transporter [Saprospiraceae bacterium]